MISILGWLELARDEFLFWSLAASILLLLEYFAILEIRVPRFLL